jgi:hypothetical protein
VKKCHKACIVWMVNVYNTMSQTIRSTKRELKGWHRRWRRILSANEWE